MYLQVLKIRMIRLSYALGSFFSEFYGVLQTFIGLPLFIYFLY